MRIFLAPALLALVVAVPLTAQDAKSDQDKKTTETARPAEPDRPITERTTTMGDAVTTPVSDLNLKKDAIPPLLLAAQQQPYDLSSLRRCGELAAAVGELDAVLGTDIDLPQDGKGGASAGRVAQAAVGAFIPFRGLIREISGANEQERRIQAAVEAGIARRSFLKGVGQARGCRYPARSAGPEQFAALAASIQAEDAKSKDKDQDKGKNRDKDKLTEPVAAAEPSRKPRGKRTKGVTFVAQPVVQQTK